MKRIKRLFTGILVLGGLAFFLLPPAAIFANVQLDLRTVGIPYACFIVGVIVYLGYRAARLIIVDVVKICTRHQFNVAFALGASIGAFIGIPFAATYVGKHLGLY